MYVPWAVMKSEWCLSLTKRTVLPDPGHVFCPHDGIGVVSCTPETTGEHTSSQQLCTAAFAQALGHVRAQIAHQTIHQYMFCFTIDPMQQPNAKQGTKTGC
jgi:hypothetical protein